MNRGLNLDLERAEQSEKDWQFGSLSPVCIASIPASLRDEYLPMGEVQVGQDDTMDCASRAPINVLEAKFTYLYTRNLLSADNRAWLESKGYVKDGRVTFSDAYVAINAGTTPNGVSMKAPLEAIRTQGLIPKAMLPLESWMTFDQYHNPDRITAAMRELGRAFRQRFTINYEQVKVSQFPDALINDMLNVAAYAWPEPVNGEYKATPGKFNHEFVLYNLPKFQAFDNYLDYDDVANRPLAGDFTKKLAPDYFFFDYGYRIVVTAQNDVREQLSLLARILDLMNSLLNALRKAPEPQPAPTPVPVPEAPPEPPQPAPGPSKLRTWALAIEQQEGGKPHHLNMKLCNPGNLKATAFTLSLAPGATKGPAATDGGHFLRFDTREHGLQALETFLAYACRDELKDYHQSRTILTFTRTYAHPPNDNYARAVAEALGVTVNTRIETLL